RHAWRSLKLCFCVAYFTNSRRSSGFIAFFRQYPSAPYVPGLVLHTSALSAGFFFQFLEPLQGADIHPAVLRLPLVEGGFAETMLATQLFQRYACFGFF